MKQYLLNFLFIAYLGTCPAFSQEVLTVDKAIEMALKNNYGIIISRNEAQQAANDHSLGNAGFLPQLNATAGGSLSSNNTLQQYSNGQEVNKNNVASNNLNAGLSMTWTLFDGMKMFASSGKLKTLAEQGELQARLTIEQTVYQLMTTYYDAVRLQQLIHSYEEALSIYQEREKITQTKFDIGSGSKQEVLQTRVDQNGIRSNLLFNQQSLENTMANLNLLMGIPAETPYKLVDSISLKCNYNRDDLLKTVINRNFSLLSAEKAVHTARYSIQDYESQRYPRLGITANYNFGRSENKAGFILLNQNLGYTAGFNLNWNLFNGFNTRRQVRNAKLTWTNAREQYEYTKATINTALLNAWRQFEQARELLKLEEENILLARENVAIALQRFKLGASGILELKDAQNSFESGFSRLVTARYNARIAELSLMKINGDLVK